ncbi:MAG: glycosyltransferase family 39 protein [Solirubrobacteraceae bacterium]
MSGAPRGAREIPTIARPARLALPALLGLTAANFLYQLGSSSYFVDEVQSVAAAASPLRGVLHAVSATELTPPAYFYFLHEWLLRLSSHAEWVARLPSALCGVLLVAAVYWLTRLLTERRPVALLAAALSACSPFVLEYAQRAQGYVFVMLAVTVAVAAAMEAERAERRRALWLAGAILACVLSLWLHYTSAFPVVALCAWVATRGSFTARARTMYLSACAIAGLALVPLLIAQHDSFPHRSGVAASAGVSGANVATLVATPFDGRLDALRLLGGLLTVGAVLVLIVLRRGVARERCLLLALAAGEPLALLALSALGGHLMLTRYAAVAAPFMIVAIAVAGDALVRISRPAAVGRRSPWLRRAGEGPGSSWLQRAVAAAGSLWLRRAVAAALGTGAVVLAVAGPLDSHRPSGFYPDARGVVGYIAARERPGDVLLTTRNPATAVPLIYYGAARLHLNWIGDAGTGRLVQTRRRRLWTILELPPGAPSARRVIALASPGAASLGYRVLGERAFPGITPLAVVLAAPIAR